MIISILMLASGLTILLIAAHVIIPGAISVAYYFRVPPHVVAVLLIAAGTSAPELIVAIQAGLNGTPQIVWGNIIGSNITNILVVLSIAGLFFPIATADTQTKRDMILLLAISTIITISAYYFSALPIFVSILLVIILAFYTLYLVRLKLDEEEAEKNTEGAELSFKRSLIYCIAGLPGLMFGADLMVNAAVDLAVTLSISKAVIGLTIIAFGTSLPEIAAAIASLFHRRVDIALGSIIGSNIFNIVAGLGITRLVSELPVTTEILVTGIPIMILSTLILALLILFKQPLGKIISVFFLAIYCLFLWLNLAIGI